VESALGAWMARTMPAPSPRLAPEQRWCTIRFVASSFCRWPCGQRLRLPGYLGVGSDNGRVDDKTGPGAKPARAVSTAWSSIARPARSCCSAAAQLMRDTMTVSVPSTTPGNTTGATATWTQLTQPAHPRHVSISASHTPVRPRMPTVRRDGGHLGRRRRHARADSWEWDSAAGTWTERTGTGDKPSRASGTHGIDSVKGRPVLFGATT